MPEVGILSAFFPEIASLYPLWHALPENLSFCAFGPASDHDRFPKEKKIPMSKKWILLTLLASLALASPWNTSAEEAEVGLELELEAPVPTITIEQEGETTVFGPYVRVSLEDEEEQGPSGEEETFIVNRSEEEEVAEAMIVSRANTPKSKKELERDIMYYRNKTANKPPQIWMGLSNPEWGDYRYMKLKAPVDLELIRMGEVIDSITIAEGTIVSTETLETGEIKAHWMGESFTIPQEILGELHREEEENEDLAAEEEPLPPIAELRTSKGTFHNVTLAKAHKASVMLRHEEGSTFIDRSELDDSAQIALGLKKAPRISTATAVKARSADLWNTTLARTTAYLNRAPFHTINHRAVKKIDGPSKLKKENFNGWPLEKMVAFAMRFHATWTQDGVDGRTTMPVEVAQEAILAIQDPDYYGPNYEKLYKVSLRPQFEKLGIKSLRQQVDCMYHADATLIVANLKLARKPSPHGIMELANRFEKRPLGDAYRYHRLIRGIYSGPVTTRELWANMGSHDYVGDNKIQPKHWMRRVHLGHRDGVPLYNELILHELRSGRPVRFGMPFTNKQGTGAESHAGIIVGARIIRPQPDLVVEYEWLNSHGPQYEDQGYGRVADFGVHSATSMRLE
jgi:hypothetical protein